MNATMNEVSLDQLKEYTRGKYYDFVSDDVHFLSIRFEHSLMEIDMNSGNDGEMVIFKPGTSCEIILDSDCIIENIMANEDCSEIMIEFKPEMANLYITLCKEQ